jgi:hypothetical protein
VQKRARKERRLHRAEAARANANAPRGPSAEDFKQRLQFEIAKLVDLLRQVDPIAIIQYGSFANTFVNPETYEEATHPGREANIEYLQSLALALSDPGTRVPTLHEAQECAARASTIVELAMLHFVFVTKVATSENASTELRSPIVQHFVVRGASYPQHERELLLGLFSKHDAELIQAIGLSCEALLDGIDTITELVSSRFEDIYNATDLRGNNEACLRRELCLLEPGIDAAPDLLHLLSSNYGSNQSFLEFEGAPAWPSNETRVLAAPLISAHNRFWAPSPAVLSRSGRHVLEKAIRRNDQYFQRSYQPARAQYLEAQACHYLARVLGGAQVYRNLHYEYDGRRYETDAIIPIGRILFIVEMKAGDFSLAARRGAPQRLKTTFKSLITDAYEQGLRTKRFIQERRIARFEDKNRKAVLEVNAAELTQVFLVNVTLAELGDLATHLNSARAAGLLPGKEWLWSVFLNDLRIVTELLESPAEFILFLQRRLALHDRGIVRASDEIDFLGLFLEQGLYFEDKEYKNAAMIVPGGLTTAIDQYYSGLTGWRSLAPKPRLHTFEEYRALVASVLALGRREAIEVGALLLGFSGVQQRDLIRRMHALHAAASRDEEVHSFTLQDSPGEYQGDTEGSSRSGLNCGITALLIPRAQDADRAVAHALRYCTVKKYQTRAPGWLLLVMRDTLPPFVADFTLLEGQWRYEPTLEKVARNVAAEFVERHIEQHGRPGRNSPCPCNSGKKFKACCLWRA